MTTTAIGVSTTWRPVSATITAIATIATNTTSVIGTSVGVTIVVATETIANTTAIATIAPGKVATGGTEVEATIADATSEGGAIEVVRIEIAKIEVARIAVVRIEVAMMSVMIASEITIVAVKTRRRVATVNAVTIAHPKSVATTATAEMIADKWSAGKRIADGKTIITNELKSKCKTTTAAEKIEDATSATLAISVATRATAAMRSRRPK